MQIIWFVRASVCEHHYQVAKLARAPVSAVAKCISFADTRGEKHRMFSMETIISPEFNFKLPAFGIFGAAIRLTNISNNGKPN